MALITTNKYSLDAGISDSKTQRVVIASDQPTISVDRGAVSAFGETEVVEPTFVYQTDFVYVVNTEVGTPITFNSGTCAKSATDAMMICSSTAAVARAGGYQTNRYLKYRSRQGNNYAVGAMFTAPVDGNIQFAGVGDIENIGATISGIPNTPVIINGYGFGNSGVVTDGFGILWFNKNASMLTRTVWPTVSSFTFIKKSQFNVDPLDGTGPSGLNLDATKLNLYQGRYPYLGVGNVFFFVEDPISSTLILVHVIQYPNNYTVPQLSNPNMRGIALSFNTTNATNKTLTITTMAGWVSGKIEMNGPRRTQTQSATVGTTELIIFAIRCNTTINGINNKSQLRLKRVSAANSGNNRCTVKLWLNPTLTTPTFTNLDATNSITAVSTTGTFAVGTGRELHALTIASQDSGADDIDDLNIYMNPGDILVITGTGAAANQAVTATLTFFEDI